MLCYRDFFAIPLRRQEPTDPHKQVGKIARDAPPGIILAGAQKGLTPDTLGVYQLKWELISNTPNLVELSGKDFPMKAKEHKT
jgi:hypothetical protein